MTDTMKAVRFHDYGGPEVLKVEQVAKPAPGPGQVLIRIHAASVNPIDWKLREGMLKAFVPLALPVVAGQDLAGVIEAVGEHVDDLQVGDAVFAMLATNVLGAYAEYAVLDRSAVARKPRSLDFVQAAAVPMGALTAWQGIVEAGGLKAGDHLFVHAAAGNVGGMAVQIAHALGAHVTAAASAEARQLVEGYGTERFIDYRTERFEDLVRNQHVVFDTLAGDMQARSWAMLRPGGILVSTLGIVDPEDAAKNGLRAQGISCSPNGAQLERVASMIDGGQVRPNVGTVVSIEEAARAQELSRAGKTSGKIVLTIG